MLIAPPDLRYNKGILNYTRIERPWSVVDAR
jgi:hypothetical protein